MMANQTSTPSSSSQNQEVTKVYSASPGRFYVLIVLALLAVHQNIAWMTFGTIPDETYKQFQLSENEITLLAGKL